MKRIKQLGALLLCLALCCSLIPAKAETAIKITAVETAGFTVENFNQNEAYYLCYPPDFDGIKFTKVHTNIPANISISVERYCDYNVGAEDIYKENQVLYLGYGRARVLVTVTSKTNAGNSASYLFTLTDPHQENYRYCYFKGVTTVYKTTSATKSNELATLQKGTSYSTMPMVIKTQGTWSQIVIPVGYTKYHGQIGWVKTADLVEEYPLTALPRAYQQKITALQQAHPNWSFEYRSMGMNMDEYAQIIIQQIKENNGTTKSREEVLAAMDPYAYLDEQNIFMFLDVTDYHAADYTQQGMQAVWIEKSGAVCTEAQAAQYFMDAGKSLRTNAYYLAARAILESGHGTSNLSKGKVGTDGKLYYNFYGIKAYDKNPSTGAVYAQQRNWNTPFRSIVEGGNWINDQYLQRGQNTAYFLRYYPYRNHLYMSDLYAPKKDAQNLYTAYNGAGKLNSSLHFIIPVFDITYPDVSPQSWYFQDVYRATEYNLFEGGTDGKFMPDNALTRAQLVTVLSRVSGVTIQSSTFNKFKDVPQGSWYHKYIAWGYTAGIVQGTSATTFAPDRAISRQELCTMLARFAASQQVNLPTATLKFTDNTRIADWAKEGVAQCVGAGLVNGMPGGSFAPNSNATRAQGAKILSLYYESFVLK